MNFPTHECPLCGAVLQLRMMLKVRVYTCPANEKTHYEVEVDEKEVIQHMYAFPYAVDNFASSGKSRLYKWYNTRWKFIKEVNRLVAEPQEELLQRLQCLIPPSGTPAPFTP